MREFTGLDVTRRFSYELTRIFITLVILVYLLIGDAYRSAFFAIRWHGYSEQIWFLLFCVYSALPLLKDRFNFAKKAGIFLGALVSSALLIKLAVIVVAISYGQRIDTFGNIQDSLLFITLSAWTAWSYCKNWQEFARAALLLIGLVVGLSI